MIIWLTKPIIRRAASLRSGCLPMSGLIVSFNNNRDHRDKVVLMNWRMPLNDDFCLFPANVIKKRLAATSGLRFSSYTSDNQWEIWNGLPIFLWRYSTASSSHRSRSSWVRHIKGNMTWAIRFGTCSFKSPQVIFGLILSLAEESQMTNHSSRKSIMR